MNPLRMPINRLSSTSWFLSKMKKLRWNVVGQNAFACYFGTLTFGATKYLGDRRLSDSRVRLELGIGLVGLEVGLIGLRLGSVTQTSVTQMVCCPNVWRPSFCTGKNNGAVFVESSALILIDVVGQCCCNT